MKSFLFFLSLVLVSTPSFAEIEVAITIDDLPAHSRKPIGVSWYDLHQKMTDTFKKHDLPPVYGFINAEKVERIPALKDALNLWVQSGNPLANHTYTHPHLRKTSAKDYIEDIDKNEAMLRELNRGMNWLFFRYPFLDEGRNKKKRKAVREHLFKNNYQIAHVTIDYGDWRWNAPYARCVNKDAKQETLDWLKDSYVQASVDYLLMYDELAKRIYNRPIKHILLAHIGVANVEALDQQLKRYKELGVKFITLEEALTDPIYEEDTGRSGGNFLDQVAANRKVRYPRVPAIPKSRLNKICK